MLSTLSAMRKIKATMRSHLTLINKKTNKCWRGCVGKRTLLCCWRFCKLVQPLWAIVWSLLKKLKTESPHGLAISLLSIYLKKTRTLIRKHTWAPVLIAALLTIAEIQKQSDCPLADTWIKKMCHIHHTHTMECQHRTLSLGFPGSRVVKNLPSDGGDTRDAGLIPGSGGSPGIGNANPL